MSDEQPKPPPSKGSARGTPTDETPFCWQSRRAIEAIENCPHIIGQRQNALLLYYTLCRVASENKPPLPTFQAARQFIAHKSGMKLSTQKIATQDLERAEVLRVERRREKGKLHQEPNVYTLLSFAYQRSPSKRSSHRSTTAAAVNKSHTKNNRMSNSTPKGVLIRKNGNAALSAGTEGAADARVSNRPMLIPPRNA